jgi:hypothetical protein
MRSIAVLIVWSLSLAPNRASAQEHALRLGPVSAFPTVTLSSLGVDTNVFNDTINPRSDTTFLLSPALELRTLFGKSSLVSLTAPSFGYFRRYANQRSKNISQTVRFERPFNRVTARAGMNIVSVRDRPALEIDTRARRLVTTYSAGVDTRVSAKTTVRAEFSRSRTAFQEGQFIGTTNLATSLNRSGEVIGLSLRHSLTALTTMVVLAERLSDRFQSTSERNTLGYRIMPGVEFSKFALVSGSASFGYRYLVPANPSVPQFRGLVAKLDLASVIRGGTKIAAFIDRDVAYSYDIERPYYVQTSTGLSVTHRLAVRWDVVGSTTLQRLAYAFSDNRGSSAGVSGPGPGVTVPADLVAADVTPDHGTTYTMGIGYRPSRGLRVGLDARRSQRVAALDRNYLGWQVGSSMTYAF